MKTKVICTIGPASDPPLVLRQLMRSGMNIARLNFSHGSHREHGKRIRLIRQWNREDRTQVKILQGLAG